MSRDLDIILRFLRAVRRQMLWRRVTETVLLMGLAGLLTFLFLLVLTAWLPDGLTSRALLWLVIIAVQVGVVVRFFGLDFLRTRTHAAMAAILQRTQSSLRNDLSSALEFGGVRLAEGLSEEIVEAHVARTARWADAQRGREHLLFTHRALGPMLRGVGAAGVVCLLVLISFPEAALNTLRFLGVGVAMADELWTQSVEQETHQEELVQSLEIDLESPSYTRVRPRRLRNTSGSIETLKGTEIRFRGHATKAAERVSVVLEDEDGVSTELQAAVDGMEVSGSFSALKDGTYRFKLKSPDGRIWDNDIPRSLKVVQDLPPVVVLTRPTGIVEVTADQVVSIEFEASDDFGLSEIAVLQSFEGVEESVERRVVELLGGQSSYIGRYDFDLRSMQLHPKDVVLLRFEALDNDEVSKPKAGQSNALRLRVESPEDHHEALIQEQQKVLDQMLSLLADYLEHPVMSDEPGQAADDGSANTLVTDDLVALLSSVRQVRDGRATLLSEMERVSTLMELDSLMLKRDYEVFKSIAGRLRRLHEDAERKLESLEMARLDDRLTEGSLKQYGRVHRMPQVSETEKSVILLEELLAAEWMDAAQMTVDSIRETKERLKELLTRYKETQDPALKAEILKEMERLQRQMSELLTRLQSQLQAVPSEYLNSESVGSSMKDMADSAGDLKDLLEAGDIDGALEALEALDAGLDEMLGLKEQYTTGGGGNGLSEMDQKASELMDAVNDLTAAESSLKKDTTELRDGMRRDRNDSLQDELEAFTKRQRGRLAQIDETLKKAQQSDLAEKDFEALEAMRPSIKGVEEMLAAKDVEGFSQKAASLSENTGDARRRLSASQGWNRKKDAAYEESLESVRSIEELSQEMERDAMELLKKAASTPEAAELDQMSGFSQQQGAIREKAEALGQEIAGMGPEFEALQQDLEEPLNKSLGFMRGAETKLDGGEVEGSLEKEGLALRALNGMKKQLQQTIQRERMGQGKQNQPQEKVEIPKDAQRAPKAFREDILDAMKQKGLDAYEGENNRYYESLIE